MADRKSFLLYTDYRQHLELLTDEERGKLFMALFDYAEHRQLPEIKGAAGMAFSFIKSQMDRDSAKYDSVCSRNRENGSKGGRPPKPKITERFLGEPKKADTDNDTDNDNDITPIAPKGAQRSNCDSRFAEFWAAYPKKVGKGAAEKSFKKYKPDDTMLSAILSAIGRQCLSDQWNRDGGQYIPNPATWLNQKRWEDEPIGLGQADIDDLEEFRA